MKIISKFFALSHRSLCPNKPPVPLRHNNLKANKHRENYVCDAYNISPSGGLDLTAAIKSCK